MVPSQTLVAALLLVLIGQGQAGSCSWLNPQFCSNVSTPVLGLYVIHMRKAGGSTILKILKNWLIRKGCVSAELAQQKGDFLLYHYNHGLPEIQGKPPWTELFEQKCPYVDIVHNEYQCTRGENMLGFPMTRRVANLTAAPTRYSALTALRDPIERIGSQAFYKLGVGSEVLHEQAKAICGKTGFLYACKKNRTSPACVCAKEAMAKTREVLRSNDTLWFEWMNKSTLGNFIGDFYSSNYYLRRMGRFHELKLSKAFQGCLKQTSSCEMIDKPNCNMLADFSGRFICGEGDVDMPSALAAAKGLLRDHLDFIITERLREDAPTIDVFSRVLRDPDFHMHHNHRSSKENAGHASSRDWPTYTAFMSDAVLEYIKEDNKYDIELYRYAVDLFNERYGPPQAIVIE